MRLNVNFSSLKIEASKMEGLEALATCLRDQKVNYQSGLKQMIEFTNDNNGTVDHLKGGITRLTVNDDQVHCFQPYPDIDAFYYEC